MAMTGTGLLLRDLTVTYPGADGGPVEAVRSVDLDLPRGVAVGLTGESGCGKSSLALACLAAAAPGGTLGGSVRLGGRELLGLAPDELGGIRGRCIAHLSQNPAGTLNPALRIGTMFGAVLRRHLGLRGRAPGERAVALLGAVGIERSEQALRRYPHEFSGGQRQRVALALALACDPGVLVLDEPTTGLDTRTRSRVLDTLGAYAAAHGTAILHVSHDLAALSRSTDRLVVMYAGEIVEEGPTPEVLADPAHPYTRALLEAVPSDDRPHRLRGLPGRPPLRAPGSACAFADRCAHTTAACRTLRPPLLVREPSRAVRCLHHDRLGAFRRSPVAVIARVGSGTPVLEVTGVTHRYPRRPEDALTDVSLAVDQGEVLAIVGGSGSGKSTLLRVAAGILTPQRGTVRLLGEDLAAAVSRRTRAQRRRLQMVFQDPDASLNPRHRVGEILRRPLRLLRDDVARGDEPDAVRALLDDVGLPADTVRRYPGQLSGGQRQRVAIARAFAARPAVLLCDEVTSSLDVSVQAGVVDLLQELAAAHRASIVFVSHDLPLVRAFCARTVLVDAGRVVDDGPTADVVGRLRTRSDRPSRTDDPSGVSICTS